MSGSAGSVIGKSSKAKALNLSFLGIARLCMAGHPVDRTCHPHSHLPLHIIPTPDDDPGRPDGDLDEIGGVDDTFVAEQSGMYVWTFLPSGFPRNCINNQSMSLAL